MDWGTDLWDQYDIIEKHTLSGLDLVEKYVKFVKERTEIEQNYAKQLRNLSKKYYPKRGSKDETECRVSSFQSFTEILNEMNDYAGQRELVAEDMMMNICIELTKYLQELKQERKTYLLEAKKAQQTLEVSYKQLDSSKKRFEREWREAERSAAYAEKTDQDINATKADVGKAKQQAHMRSRIAEECKNDYAAQLQKCNKEQNQFYFNDMPVIFNKLQDMDERRGQRLADGYVLFSDTEKHVMPIIDKCLEGIHKAGCNVNQRNDSLALVEQHKSGFERPGDIEFEDYSQGINRASSDSSLSTPKGPLELLGKNRNRKSWLLKKSKPTVTEDFGHLPPEQRRKRLQKKRDEIAKELQKEVDQSEALEKMRDVYEKNPQMGDPASLAPQNSQTAQNIERLRGELAKYETWVAEAGVRGSRLQQRSQSFNNNGAHDVYSPDGAQSDEGTPDHSQAIYAEFDDDFEEEEEEEVEEEEPTVAIGNCTAMYNFPGASEGTISMQEGEVLDVVEEDKGDGWTRVRRTNGDEGYIPTSYVSIALTK
ncbi:cdc42-interacting protein 4 homolog isoform X3 [Gadus chalcogrammus]|uniref:cdc42-interacting protein 4 homolog isoform X3 n=1 Tax=Gadus chalcogrammus TaxID=1042646 RepID=UPI0024C378B4|nr:cdc42-interacting protein 4 homolog isoform X3 [Gadus chalcogrammus]